VNSFSTSGKMNRSRRSVKFALLAMIAAIAGFSTTSPAYVLNGRSWPTGTVLILQLSMGNPGFPLQDGSTSWNAAVAPAATMWSQSILRMQMSSLFLPSVLPASSGDQLNSVVFASSVFGQPFGGSTLAVTYYRYTGSTMVEADILFNQARTFDSYRGPLQFPGPGPAIADIRRVFLHELGHALGLGHPDNGGQQVVAVMNSIMSNQEVLSSDDIAGGQFLYGIPGLPTPTPTPFPTPPPTSASHLANISTRMKVGVGDNVLIGGFMVRGTQPKKLILRAIGPSLAGLGLPGAMPDPVLELHGSGGMIASNDDWSTGSQTAEIQASGLAPTEPVESAIIATLSPGNYTAVVSGYGGGQGIGLVEAYEFDGNATRMVNISTRGRVGTGTELMIGGLIVQGSALKRVIVRALGPSLAGGPIPIGGVLADPTLALHDGNGNLLAQNDDWSNGAQAGEIIATTIPPGNNLESAIIATLGPGSCTAIVRGVNNTSGVGLVEVYDLDP
jgi:hypothetical protein